MKTRGNYRYLFGPVPSRRFGRSLGVDLTPFKTCSFDCIFCQLGRTTRKTLTRRAYVPVGAVIEGQRAFREAFKGELWMEVFLVWGTNTVRQDVARIADLVKTIGPDRIQLNTSVRPPCEEYACSVPAEQMDSLSRLFVPLAEVLAEYGADVSAYMPANEIEVLNMLRRRPCTISQISKVFGLHRNEILKRLGKLVRTGQAQERRSNGETFYIGVHPRGTRHANLKKGLLWR